MVYANNSSVEAPRRFMTYSCGIREETAKQSRKNRKCKSLEPDGGTEFLCLENWYQMYCGLSNSGRRAFCGLVLPTKCRNQQQSVRSENLHKVLQY